MDTMLTVEEVAAILKVQPLTVRQMFREGRIRGFKIGKAWRTTMPILEEDISCMSRGTAAPRLDESAQASGFSAPAAGEVPGRKRRPKAAPDAAAPPASAPPAPQADAPPSAPEPDARSVAPTAEEAEAVAKRRRKAVPEESTEQQLLF